MLATVTWEEPAQGVRWDFLLSGICSCYWSGSPEGQALAGSAPFECVSFLLLVPGAWLQRRGVLKKVGLMCLQKSLCSGVAQGCIFPPVVVVPDLVQFVGWSGQGQSIPLAGTGDGCIVVMGTEVTALPSEVVAASVVLLE